MTLRYSERLDSAFPLNPASRFPFLSFVFSFFFAFTRLREQNLLFMRQILLFTHCSSKVHTLKNIKDGSHGTIYTFKNYFATVFSVSATINSIQTDPYYHWYLYHNNLF